MSKDKDGMAKNLSVVWDELKDWGGRMKDGIKRFKDASLRFGSKNNVIHLMVNLIKETIAALPRTITYILVIMLVWWAAVTWVL